MPGRKAKPTALKLVNGNPGKRPLNENEPKVDIVEGELPKPPKWLKGAAKTEWNLQIKYLTSNRVLGENEISMLAQYCYLSGKFAEEATLGRVMMPSHIGQMRGLSADLGIGPSNRTKVKAGAKSVSEEEKRFFG